MDELRPSQGATSTMHEYVVDFVTGGVYMLLRRWAEEGMKTPSAQVGRLAYQLVAHMGSWVG